jgi:16S rRNA (uracil1498-N3)-methyltransferase
MRRFFVPADSVRGDNCTIEGSDARHLAQTLRAPPGYEFEATDGRGNSLRLVAVSVSPARIECKILEAVPVPERSVSVALFQSVPRQFKMDDVVRSCVELGVDLLVPLLTERSEPRYDPKPASAKADRWNRVAQETAKRVGRTTTMKIETLRKAGDMPGLLRPGSTKILLWELDRERSLKAVLRAAKGPRAVDLLIGAEGGFGSDEVGTFEGMGFTAASLGERVLTVETAVLTTLANVYYELDSD